MSEKYPYKNVPVLPETHHRLRVLKAERGDKTFDDSVSFLMDRGELVQQQEQRIIQLEKEVKKLGGIP